MRRLASFARAGRAAAGSSVVAISVGFWYRPEVDLRDGFWVHTLDRRIPVPPGGVWWESIRTSRPLSERKGDEEPLLLQAARWLVIVSVSVVFIFVLKLLNTLEIERDEHFLRFLHEVEHRDSGRALITVSNHSSTIDDPALLVASMPLRVLLNPSKIRWTFCTQDVCFRRPVLAGIAAAGKVLPIKKGGGIDQPLLAEVQRRIALGCWMHIFPEGKVNQCRQLGVGFYDNRSQEQAESIGRLKWGIGKLVAHSPVPVTLIPLHHIGMEEMVKLHQQPPYSIDIKSCRVGQRVRLSAGAVVHYEDLIEQHERLYGKVAKFDPHGEGPVATQELRELYSAITRRVEQALLVLESRMEASMSHE